MRCGHHIHKAQNFCTNCGYKIGAPCLGKINGNPCTKFLNVEIKFCGNCGTANPDHLAGKTATLVDLYCLTQYFDQIDEPISK